jgi:hypothetical protein
MKHALAVTAAAALATSALGQSTPLAHIQTGFDFVVPAPVDQAMLLFGPEGERPWAGKRWNPQFLYPQPAADIEGAVFTIQHGPLNAVWINTLFDKSARHFQYVYFLPGIMVTVIDVRFNPAGADSTAVNVVYTRTAISEEGNDHVKTMSEGDKSAGPEWQAAIEKHLAQAKPALAH